MAASLSSESPLLLQRPSESLLEEALDSVSLESTPMEGVMWAWPSMRQRVLAPAQAHTSRSPLSKPMVMRGPRAGYGSWLSLGKLASCARGVRASVVTRGVARRRWAAKLDCRLRLARTADREWNGLASGAPWSASKQ